MDKQQVPREGLSERDKQMMRVNIESEQWAISEGFETVEAEQGTHEYDWAISIHLDGTETPDQIKKLIKQQLPEYFWWLNPHWKEKGKPSESIEIETQSGKRVELLNWHRPLTDGELAQLREAMELFASAYEGQVLKSLRYILVDNHQSSEPLKTGGLKNGYGTLTGKRDGNDGIILYPAAFAGVHRAAANMSNFKGTLVHESTHHIALWNKPLLDDWMDKFGWNDQDDEAVEARNARCITDYAKWKADEDVCDSMVAKVAENPDLDSEKAQFIQEKVMDQKIEDGLVGVNRLSSDQIEPPKLPERIYYRKAPTIKINISQ